MKKKQLLASILFSAILASGCGNSDDSADAFDNTDTETLYQSSTATESAGTTDVVTVEVIPGEYSEFTPPMSEAELNGVDFTGLPEGSRELFENAMNIWRLYYIDSMLCNENTAETITLPINESSYVYYRTGISYDSFDVYLKSVFTDDYVEKLKSNVTFINNYDELLCLNVKGVENSDFTSLTFEITEQTDDYITITGTAKYVADDGYTYEKELSQQLYSVGGALRLSVFNCWY